MFFDDVKTLYDLDAPDTHRMRVEQTYSDTRRGSTATLDSLAYLPLADLKVTDLDTAEAFAPDQAGREDRSSSSAVPIANERQSAHIRITGTLTDAGYTAAGGDLVFRRTLHGLRNTVLLPAGWDVTAVSQSGTIGEHEGRAFVALINLNAENRYAVTIHARKRADAGR